LLRDYAEERSSQLLRGGILESRIKHEISLLLSEVRKAAEVSVATASSAVVQIFDTCIPRLFTVAREGNWIF
jgi:hypothetical protein